MNYLVKKKLFKQDQCYMHRFNIITVQGISSKFVYCFLANKNEQICLMNQVKDHRG